jgi:hypothetical protein
MNKRIQHKAVAHRQSPSLDAVATSKIEHPEVQNMYGLAPRSLVLCLLSLVFHSKVIPSFSRTFQHDEQVSSHVLLPPPMRE